jgi:23S rRNA-/tRNA-specific pseudouridylate synthase
MEQKNVQTEKDKITLDCKVDSYRSGWTVVEFLSHRFRYHPAERWTHRVDDGRVTVNGSRVNADHPVNHNDVVSYTIIHNEPEVDFGYRIVYEDGDMMAVSKPGNLPVHACGVYIRNTLITHLRNRYGDHISLGHRLDRETSGLVLLSKHVPAARALSGMFAKGTVEKSYVAVVHGHVEADAFEVDAPIGKTEDIIPIVGDRETMRGRQTDLREDFPRLVPKRIVDFESGKPARTGFEVRRRAQGYTVLDARPLSGRTNQIRVHLHHVGHPLVGDKVYRFADQSDGVPRIGRHALHCGSLRFEHPITAAPMSLTADVPDDLEPFL